MLHPDTSLLGLDEMEQECYWLLWEISESSLLPPHVS